MKRFWRDHTTADLLTLSRLVASPLLLVAAVGQSPHAFAMLLAWGVLTDIADGAIARARGEVTPAGAALDSRADVAFYGSTLLALGVLMPERLSDEWPLLTVIVAAYALPIGLGWWKFGRLTSYHTVLARLALALLVAGLGAWIMFEQIALSRLGALVLVVSAVEETLLTLLLDSPRDNISHLLVILRHPTTLLERCLPIRRRRLRTARRTNTAMNARL